MVMEKRDNDTVFEVLKNMRDLTKRLRKSVSYNGFSCIEGDLILIEETFRSSIVKLENKTAQTEKSFKNLRTVCPKYWKLKISKIKNKEVDAK